MTIYLNDQELKMEQQATLAALLLDKGIDDSGVAIALNGQIIPKSNWQNTTLTNQDKLVVITATAGG